MQYGDPDGFGLHGQLTVTDDGERVVCHDCGVERKGLGSHIFWVHDSTAVEYRRAHGLSTGQALTSPATSARHAAHALSHPAILESLRTHGRTDGWKWMTAEGQQRPQRVAVRKATGARSRLGRPLTDEEVASLAATTTVAEWTSAVRRIVEEGGTSIAAVSRATGVNKGTIRDRLKPRRAERTRASPHL